MNKIYLLLTLFIFALTNISAQTPEATPTPRLDVKTVQGDGSKTPTNREGTGNLKAVSGGILNGKAISLTKPSFPAAARAVGASGAVSVQVLIDEEGNVASASAVSGHPLLRQASEKAALTSKFSTTTLQGQPVKVAGIIVYNFVLPMTFVQIGFDLALIEKSKSFPADINVNSISLTLPRDWEKEKSDLSELLKPKKSQIPVETLKNIHQEPLLSDSETKTIKTVSASPVIDESVDRTGIAAEVAKNIENRLLSNAIQLWKFKVGRILGSIAAQLEDEAKIKSEASNLNELISNAPSEVSSTLEGLQKFVQLIQTNDSTPERTAEIKLMAAKLRNF